MTRSVQDVHFSVRDAHFQDCGVGWAFQQIQRADDDAGRSFEFAQAGGKVHVQKTFTQADNGWKVQQLVAAFGVFEQTRVGGDESWREIPRDGGVEKGVGICRSCRVKPPVDNDACFSAHFTHGVS